MDNIIILLLFTYPGAIAELVLSQFAGHRSFIPKRDGMQATVRYFFYSTIISTCSLVVFALVSGVVSTNLTDWIEKMKSDWNIALYLLISFVLSFLFAIFWYWLMKNVVHGLVTKYRKKRNIPCDPGYVDVWKHTIMSPDVMDIGKVAVIVKKGNETLSCGLVHSISDDIQKTPEITLRFCDHVAVRLANEKDIPDEDRTIGDDILTYINPVSGYQVIFKDASKFVQELVDYQRSVISSEA